MSDLLQVTIEQAIATLALNRPQLHNAFDAALISELTETLLRLDNDTEIRAVVLTGNGASFSAGADLNWMRDMAGASEAENCLDSLRLAKLMRTLQFLSKPTLARVNGAAYGGGVGLIACCDIAIAADHAKFGLTETRLGLVPAVISPYVLAAIGLNEARRFFLTAEIFGAETAKSIGLVHAVVAPDLLDAAIEAQLNLLLKTGPVAVSEAKSLALRAAGLDLVEQEQLDTENAKLIARLRISPEGQEGLNAFLGKRQAAWIMNR